ncbi:magnesium-translocating P-type ATPase [Massilia sp. erpn]|uniref:magnesium-translocating P-type ATPase n=1 Tax=Massilia sp. erpn TaxID=2738142 RepID=UPI002103F764|nr:magnesium-translocating P-type ATPase [Massilia sp. erpn]UTY59184.1 magnesium-translocating P-type ATPase [Massilia sp. erpn]
MTLFKHLFASFLNSRHLARLFRRSELPLPTAQGAAKVLPNQLGLALGLAAREAQADLFARLASGADGLSNEAAQAVVERDGPNEMGHEKALGWHQRLWQCYRNPFNVLLTVLALVSWLTEDVKATIVIGTMVVLSTLLRFVQEGRSSRAAERLQALVSNTATVLRDGQPCELAIRELAAGDVVMLSAGDMIPADCRLLAAKDLFVSQAAMTGESLPVEKSAEAPSATVTDPFDMANLLFTGTNVISGSATAIVLSTGNRTCFGALADRVVSSERAPTAFQAGINSVSWLLIRFALVMAPLVFVVNGFTKGDWSDAFLFALSIAVGLTPEMLPMIVTSTLAKGAVLLARRKVVVKRLDAIQSFGAMTVLCTDKTGTLTQDEIVLERHADISGQESEDVLKFAFLNSHYQTGLKNLLDRAVLKHVEMLNKLNLAQDYRKIDEIPFDFVRRRMSVVVSEQEDHHELICKGAVEEILACCTAVRQGEQVLPLDDAMLARVTEHTRSLNAQGLRVVALAVKEVPPQKAEYSLADESDLTLIGYIAFLDPPKDSSAPALRALAAHGVTVKVLTGDNHLVTARVCRDVGLQVDGVILGPDLDALDDAALADVAERNTVFAKLSPLHKERLVSALRSQGHIVGFMGDGINDAPALRAADIGISVDSAVDIAKEAADIILLEKSLMVLEEGVLQGRRTFCNMLKYIRMTASSNFGNVFSVLVASVFLPFLPMLPVHLLVQNLLYDVSQIAIPFDNVDAELVAQPLDWNPRDIGRFMLFFGPLSSIFDIATFGLMWYIFGANAEAKQTLFQSGWFIVGLLTQTLIVHLIRTPKLPFVQSLASPALLFATLAIMALGIWLPMGPLAHAFKLQALPMAYFPWLLSILLAYAGLTTLMKRVYRRKFGWQ